MTDKSIQSEDCSTDALFIFSLFVNVHSVITTCIVYYQNKLTFDEQTNLL